MPSQSVENLANIFNLTLFYNQEGDCQYRRIFTNITAQALLRSQPENEDCLLLKKIYQDGPIRPEDLEQALRETRASRYCKYHEQTAFFKEKEHFLMFVQEKTHAQAFKYAPEECIKWCLENTPDPSLKDHIMASLKLQLNCSGLFFQEDLCAA